jgi:hypothetical protein
MELWSEIRRRVVTGELSLRQACSEYGLKFRTIRKIVRHPEPPPYHTAQPRAKPVLGPFLPLIHQILDEDQLAPPKQRHTARRIYERLCEEHAYTGCASIVRASSRNASRKLSRSWVSAPMRVVYL